MSVILDFITIIKITKSYINELILLMYLQDIHYIVHNIDPS